MRRVDQHKWQGYMAVGKGGMYTFRWVHGPGDECHNHTTRVGAPATLLLCSGDLEDIWKRTRPLRMQCSAVLLTWQCRRVWALKLSKSSLVLYLAARDSWLGSDNERRVVHQAIGSRKLELPMAA